MASRTLSNLGQVTTSLIDSPARPQIGMLGPWFPADRPISRSAMDLIARLLETDIANRLTAKEALAHPWFGSADKQPLHPEVRDHDRTLNELVDHSLSITAFCNSFVVPARRCCVV